jgi:hypothetical protein
VWWKTRRRGKYVRKYSKINKQANKQTNNKRATQTYIELRGAEHLHLKK